MTRSATNNRNNIRKVLAGKRARTCKNQRGGKQPLSSLLGTTHTIECKIVEKGQGSSGDGVKFSPGKATEGMNMATIKQLLVNDKDFMSRIKPQASAQAAQAAQAPVQAPAQAADLDRQKAAEQEEVAKQKQADEQAKRIAADEERQKAAEQAEVTKYNNEYTKKHGKRSVNFFRENVEQMKTIRAFEKRFFGTYTGFEFQKRYSKRTAFATGKTIPEGNADGIFLMRLVTLLYMIQIFKAELDEYAKKVEFGLSNYKKGNFKGTKAEGLNLYDDNVKYNDEFVNELIKQHIKVKYQEGEKSYSEGGESTASSFYSLFAPISGGKNVKPFYGDLQNLFDTEKYDTDLALKPYKAFSDFIKGEFFKDVLEGAGAEEKAKKFKYYLLLFISYYNADAKFHKGSPLGSDGGEYKVITDIKQALFGGTRASTNVLYSSYRSTSVNRAITSMVTGLNNIELYKGIYNDKESFFYIYTGNDNLNYVGIHNDKSLEPFNKVIEEAKRMQKSEILNKDKTIFYKKGAEKYEVQQGGTGSQFKTGFDEKGPLRVLGELIEGLAVLEKASNNINNPYNAGYYIPYMKTLMKGLKKNPTSENIINKKAVVDSLEKYINFYTGVITDPVFTSSLNRKKSIKKEAEATGDGSDGSNYVIARVKMDRVQADLLTVIFLLNLIPYMNSNIKEYLETNIINRIFSPDVGEEGDIISSITNQEFDKGFFKKLNNKLNTIVKEYNDLFTNYKAEKGKLEEKMSSGDAKTISYLESQGFKKIINDNHERIIALHKYFNLSKNDSKDTTNNVAELNIDNIKKLRVIKEDDKKGGFPIFEKIKKFVGQKNISIKLEDAPALPLEPKIIEEYPNNSSDVSQEEFMYFNSYVPYILNLKNLSSKVFNDSFFTNEPILFKTFLQDKFTAINNELEKIDIDNENTNSKGIITNASNSLQALKSVLKKWASLIGFEYIMDKEQPLSEYKVQMAIFKYDKDKLDKDSKLFDGELLKKAEEQFGEIVYGDAKPQPTIFLREYKKAEDIKLQQIDVFEKNTNVLNAAKEGNIEDMKTSYKDTVVKKTIEEEMKNPITEETIQNFKTAFKFTDKEFQEQIYKDFATAALEKMKKDVTDGTGSTKQDLKQATKVLELVLRQRDIVRSANTFIQVNKKAEEEVIKAAAEEKKKTNKQVSDLLTGFGIEGENDEGGNVQLPENVKKAFTALEALITTKEGGALPDAPPAVQGPAGQGRGRGGQLPGTVVSAASTADQPSASDPTSDEIAAATRIQARARGNADRARAAARKIEQNKKDAKELGAITKAQALGRGWQERRDVATVTEADDAAAERAKENINTKMDEEKKAVTTAVEEEAKKNKEKQEEINKNTQDANIANLEDKEKIVNSLVEKTQKNVQELKSNNKYEDIARKLLEVIKANDTKEKVEKFKDNASNLRIYFRDVKKISEQQIVKVLNEVQNYLTLTYEKEKITELQKDVKTNFTPLEQEAKQNIDNIKINMDEQAQTKYDLELAIGEIFENTKLTEKDSKNEKLDQLNNDIKSKRAEMFKKKLERLKIIREKTKGYETLEAYEEPKKMQKAGITEDDLSKINAMSDEEKIFLEQMQIAPASFNFEHKKYLFKHGLVITKKDAEKGSEQTLNDEKEYIDKFGEDGSDFFIVDRKNGGLWSEEDKVEWGLNLLLYILKGNEVTINLRIPGKGTFLYHHKLKNPTGSLNTQQQDIIKKYFSSVIDNRETKLSYFLQLAIILSVIFKSEPKPDSGVGLSASPPVQNLIIDDLYFQVDESASNANVKKDIKTLNENIELISVKYPTYKEYTEDVSKLKPFFNKISVLDKTITELENELRKLRENVHKITVTVSEKEKAETGINELKDKYTELRKLQDEQTETFGTLEGKHKEIIKKINEFIHDMNLKILVLESFMARYNFVRKKERIMKRMRIFKNVAKVANNRAKNQREREERLKAEEDERLKAEEEGQKQQLADEEARAKQDKITEEFAKIQVKGKEAAAADSAATMLQDGVAEALKRPKDGGGVSEEVTMLGKYALLAKKDRENINSKITTLNLDEIKDSQDPTVVIPVFHDLQKYFEGSKDLTEIIAILKTNEKDEIKKPKNIELTEITKDPNSDIKELLNKINGETKQSVDEVLESKGLVMRDGQLLGALNGGNKKIKTAVGNALRKALGNARGKKTMKALRKKKSEKKKTPAKKGTMKRRIKIRSGTLKK